MSLQSVFSPLESIISSLDPSGPIPILAGPTAVGKTAISLSLAEKLNAEIISADSRQVYRELVIGTARPEPEELARIPHHFVAELSLGTPFSAGTFALQAFERIQQIRDRGRVPLVVGGSTLYIHALLEGLADVPPVDPALRAQLEQRLELEGKETLYQELERLDPDFAQTLDPTKTQRLVRALEVFYGTGKPLSSYYQNQPPSPFAFQLIVLTRDRAELYDRINQRVDQMLLAGLLDEVAALIDGGYDLEDNALRTIGYQEPIAFLKGEIDFDEMVFLLKRNSRRYAKRQLTWFRRYQKAFFLTLQ